MAFLAALCINNRIKFDRVVSILDKILHIDDWVGVKEGGGGKRGGGKGLVHFSFGCHLHAGGLFMLVKVRLEGESFATALAGERLQIGMSLNVGT